LTRFLQTRFQAKWDAGSREENALAIIKRKRPPDHPAAFLHVSVLPMLLFADCDLLSCWTCAASTVAKINHHFTLSYYPIPRCAENTATANTIPARRPSNL
jgi:hypothetical protein